MTNFNLPTQSVLDRRRRLWFSSFDFCEADRFRSAKSFKVFRVLWHFSRCCLTAFRSLAIKGLVAKFIQSRRIASRSSSIYPLSFSSSVFISNYSDVRSTNSLTAFSVSAITMAFDRTTTADVCTADDPLLLFGVRATYGGTKCPQETLITIFMMPLSLFFYDCSDNSTGVQVRSFASYTLT